MSLSPEQGGEDYAHLKSEYDHLVIDLRACRRSRSASAAYAVKLEDALRGLGLALMTAREVLLTLGPGDVVRTIDEAVDRAALVLPSVRIDTRRKS